MNRSLFFLGSSLLFTSLAHAQVGVRAGAHAVGIHTNTADDGTRTTAKSRVGYQLGVYDQQKLTRHFSLVPEVQFSREQTQVNLERYSSVQIWQGSSTTLKTTTLQTTQGEYQLNLSYVNVPVLLRFALGPIYLEAGPQASWLVGGQGKGQVIYLIGGDAYYYNEIKQAATDRFRRFDAGACVGIGVSMPAGLGLNVRAYQGFIALDKDNPYSDLNIPYFGSKTYRQTLQASLTYQLRGHS